jgi:hypothetical protein
MVAARWVKDLPAEGAVTAWRRHLLRTQKARPSTVNQALAAVTLLYEHGTRERRRPKPR